MLELRLYSENPKALNPEAINGVLAELVVEDGLISRTTHNEDFFAFYSRPDALVSETVYRELLDIQREPLSSHDNLGSLMNRNSVLKVDIRQSSAIAALVKGIQKHVAPTPFYSSIEGVKFGKSDIIVFEDRLGHESVRLIARTCFCLYLISDSWVWSTEPFANLLHSKFLPKWIQRLETFTGELKLHCQTIT